MKNLGKILLTLQMILIISLLPVSTSAQGGNQPPGGAGGGNPPGSSGTTIKIVNPLKIKTGSLPDMIKSFIDAIVLPVGGIVAVLMIMWAGFLFVTSGGNQAKAGKARDALVNAAIGSAILLGAYTLSTVIKGTVDALGK